jgi:hypothetical protein
VPSDPTSFPKLASPITSVSVAQGIACLDCIARAVGIEKLEKFQAKYLAGARARAAKGHDYLKSMWPKTTVRPAPLKPEVCSLLLAAARPLQLQVAETSSESLDVHLTRLLILSGDPDGGWGSKFRRAFVPSSSRARLEVFKDMPGRNWKAWRLDYPIELNKAHVTLWNVTQNEFNVSPAVAFATATAVHYLASQVTNPAATLQQLCADPALAEQRKGLDALLLTPIPPKPAPVVAAKPVPKKAEPKAEQRPVAKAEENVPPITIKPADTTKKKDESF